MSLKLLPGQKVFIRQRQTWRGDMLEPRVVEKVYKQYVVLDDASSWNLDGFRRGPSPTLSRSHLLLLATPQLEHQFELQGAMELLEQAMHDTDRALRNRAIKPPVEAVRTTTAALNALLVFKLETK